MKRASNTLLTLHPFCSEAMPAAPAEPREFRGTVGCPLTPFHNRQAGFAGISPALLDLSCLPRSSYRSRLGEGSVRSSLDGILRILILVSMFAALHSARAAEIDSGQPDALLQVVRAHIAQVTPWKDSEIQVRSIKNFTASEFPAGEFSFCITSREPLGSYHNALIPIEIRQGERLVRTIWIAADVVIRATVVQATAKLQYGGIIAPGDVKEVLMDLPDARASYLRTCSEAVGKVMRRTLSPGDPLTRESVSSPLMVHSGDTVRIRLERGPIALSAQARAEQDGRLGETIRIRSLEFSRQLKATVIGRGEVRID